MDEQKIYWTKLAVPVDKLMELKPNYSMTFHNGEKQVGALDFNGPEMVFTGDADESAKVFFDFIAQSFKGRLEQERADEREACAKVAEDMNQAVLAMLNVTRQPIAIAAAIRAMGNT